MHLPLPRLHVSRIHYGTETGNDRHVGNSEYVLCAEKTGSKFFYQFRPQGFLNMANDRAGSLRDVCFEVLLQSMPIDNGFLCGYRLIID